MTEEAKQPSLSRSQTLGLIIFFPLCGLPALEIPGFGFGIPITLPSGLIIAGVGGAVGGALICPRPILAGLVGGLAAGPVGLFALYCYTLHRTEVWNVELVLVQRIASLPGAGLGVLAEEVDR